MQIDTIPAPRVGLLSVSGDTYVTPNSYADHCNGHSLNWLTPPDRCRNVHAGGFSTAVSGGLRANIIGA
jgi:hypothetical protein